MEGPKPYSSPLPPVAPSDRFRKSRAKMNCPQNTRLQTARKSRGATGRRVKDRSCLKRTQSNRIKKMAMIESADPAVIPQVWTHL